MRIDSWIKGKLYINKTVCAVARARDSKGRVVLPKKEREKMGIKRRVLLINAGDHIKIIPLPEKPLDALEGALKIETPFNELRKAAEKLAAEEARRGGQCH